MSQRKKIEMLIDQQKEKDWRNEDKDVFGKNKDRHIKKKNKWE